MWSFRVLRLEIVGSMITDSPEVHSLRALQLRERNTTLSMSTCLLQLNSSSLFIYWARERLIVPYWDKKKCLIGGHYSRRLLV